MDKAKGKPLANPHRLLASADSSLFLFNALTTSSESQVLPFMALECVTHPTCSLHLETALHAQLPPKVRIPQESNRILATVSPTSGYPCALDIHAAHSMLSVSLIDSPTYELHPFLPPSPCCSRTPKAASGHVSEPFLHSHSVCKACLSQSLPLPAG